MFTTTNTFRNHFAVAFSTMLFSTAMVLGAVGPGLNRTDAKVSATTLVADLAPAKSTAFSA